MYLSITHFAVIEKAVRKYLRKNPNSPELRMAYEALQETHIGYMKDNEYKKIKMRERRERINVDDSNA